MLERMYLRWAEAQGHRTRVVDRQQGKFQALKNSLEARKGGSRAGYSEVQ